MNVTNPPAWRFAVDRGGTFTDVVATTPDGRLVTDKLLSANPGHYGDAASEAVRRLMARYGEGPIAELRIGTTVATNALLERKGANVGLLTTEGHRDILEMREGLKPDRYNMRMARAEPLVPRDRRLGVTERIRPDGRVEIPL
ncbi:MAG: hydantoinase/oxoprolinase N-terminal domain-containing protein, partial [Erythrobacter sp.]|nr:hydantoinase/oxoprolinase N-terminal domain-containing protein [Erythrobacter sp.]